VINQVSIITRTKDRPVLLKRAIESVLNQTYTDWLHVIVNDGGEKEAVESILKPFRDRYRDRLQILHHDESLGMQEASNAGIKNSNGEFIVIHDDDDSWSPEFLNACLNFLEAEGSESTYQGVITRTERIYEEIDENRAIIEKFREEHIPLEEVSLYRAGFENPFAPIAFLFRRSAYEELGSFNPRYTVLGDWDFHYRFLQRFEVGIVSKSLAFYHWRLKSERLEDANSVTESIDEHRIRLNELSNNYLREDPIKGLLFNIPRLQYQNHHLLLKATDDQVQSLQESILDLKHEVQQLKGGIHHAAYMASRLENKIKHPHQLAKWIIKKYEFLANLFSLRWLPLGKKIKRNIFMPFSRSPAKSFDLDSIKFQMDKAELVAFDVFDTCLHRIVGKPTDLFILLGEKCHGATGLNHQVFAEERVKSEEHARLLSEKADISLEEVYDVFLNRNNLSTDLKAGLMEAEIILEHQLVYANPDILKLYQYAKASRKRVLFISDMYLPARTVESLLQENGFQDTEVLVSSETGLTKGSGALFDFILSKFGVSPEKILFFDDNHEWAITPAEERNIRTYHWAPELRPKCLAEEVQPEKAKNYKDALDTLTYGLAKKRVMTQSPQSVSGQTNGDSILPRSEKAFWENLGYQVAGPLYFFYTQWIIQRSLAKGLGKLIFLSRDGYYLQKTFQILKSCWKLDLDSQYLYSSRRFFNLAAIDEMDLEAKGFLLGPNPNLTLRDYFQRMGLEAKKYEALVQAHGFNSIDDSVTSAKASFLNEETQDSVHKLFADLTPDILEICNHERQKLKSYLEDTKFDPYTSGIVDIGWQASSIQSMDRLTKSIFGSKSQGFYFATWNYAHAAIEQGCQFESFFTHLGKPWYRGQILIESVAIIEKFFSAPHPSVLSVQKNGQKWEPVFPHSESSDNLPTEEIYGHLWEGAQAFIEDIAAHVPGPIGDTGHTYLETTLERLLHHPTQEEARLLGKLHHRESYGNVQSKAIIQKPTARLRSNKPLVDQLLASEWRKGYLTLLDDGQRRKIGNYHTYLKKP
jgi:predicted HAD superfamily hydrolase/glycosyltransferase involved in cell wall biosynthesis